MKFIHIADVHLGACPDAGKAYTENRKQELWDTFEKVLQVCEAEQADLFLIAGDLFHRQPLLRELKEIDYLFSKLTKTKVVLIAGNHDYLKIDSYYRKYRWKSQVYFLGEETVDHIEFPEIHTCVYGLSYTRKEITEPLYDNAFAKQIQDIEILLAHGGDEKHIPFKKERILKLGYDYVALGHIHRMMVLEKDKVQYAGSLEPTDKNDIGQHGYYVGEIHKGRVRTKFVPFASRECIHARVKMNEFMTKAELKEKVRECILENGVENIYKITIEGFCAEDFEIDFTGFDVYGNVLEFVNEVNIAYDFERLHTANTENLIGKYIESFEDCEKNSIEYCALFEGIHALLCSKRG